MVISKQSDKWPLLFFVMMIIFLNSEICLSKAPVRPANQTGCYQTTSRGYDWSLDYCKSPNLCRNNGGFWDVSSNQCISSRDIKDPVSTGSAGNDDGSSFSSGQSCSDGLVWDGKSCKSKSLVCADETQKNNNPACGSSSGTREETSKEDSEERATATIDNCCLESNIESCAANNDSSVEEYRNAHCSEASGNGDSANTSTAGAPAVVDDCEEKATTAKSSCNFEGDSLSSEIGKYVGVTTQALNGSGASVTQACGEIGKLSQGANMAMFAFQENCNRDQSACVQSCQKVRQQGANGSLSAESIQAAGKNLQDCQNLAANIQKSQQYLMSLMQTTRSAQNCGQQSGDDFCKLYPTVGTCQTKLVSDCSNPTYAAANKICACATSGPGSLACLQAQASSQKLTTDPGSLTAAAAKGGGPGLDLSSDETNQGPIDLSGNNGPAEDIGGNKGGRSANGGSVGGGGGYAGGGGGGSGERQGLLGGFFGGNSSIGGFASAVGGAINKLIGREESSKKDKGPDLRQFLPGGKFDPKIRGLAGATGPDGITGPHTNIWKKINNRYQSQKVSLLP